MPDRLDELAERFGIADGYISEKGEWVTTPTETKAKVLEDIQACLAYAADRERERVVVTSLQSLAADVGQRPEQRALCPWRTVPPLPP